MLLDCFNPSQMLWKPSYYLVRGSSLDGYPCRLDGWLHSIGLGERGRNGIQFQPSIRSHKSTEAVGQTNRKHQQCRAYYSITKSITSPLQSTLQPTVGVEVDRCLLHSSLHLIPTIESLNLIPTIESLNLIPTATLAYIESLN